MTGPADLSPYDAHRVTYPSDGHSLVGYFNVPAGEGPFPGLVFSHGSAGLLPECFAGISALVELGYAVLAATRRGHNGNSGPYWRDLVLAATGSDQPLFAALGDQFVRALYDESSDVLAALDWLERQPRIDPARMGTVGQSFGGIMSVFATARTDRIKAGVSFAGPSITWPHVPALQQTLLDMVREVEAPLLLIQAENDHSLAPTYALAGELARLGKPHEVRVYPRLGESAMDGHGLFGSTVDWWRGDIAWFLSRYLGTGGAGRTVAAR